MIGMSRLAAAAGIMLAAALPTAAAAEQTRATLSVSAVVQPSCRIDGRSAGAQGVACSSGERIPAATIAYRDEKPLEDAAAMLGAPTRGARGIEFGASARPAAAQSNEDRGTTRYLTLTY
jgi:hypothetical protein